MTNEELLAIFDEAYAIWRAMDWTEELEYVYDRIYHRSGTPTFSDDAFAFFNHLKGDIDWLRGSMVHKMSHEMRAINKYQMLRAFRHDYPFMRGVYYGEGELDAT